MHPSTICPRCRARSTRNEFGGRGALSRTDNRTEVCSDCGLDEAILSWRGDLEERSTWPIASLRS